MRDLQQYVRPGSPQEAAGIKREYGGRAVYLAGGTDLLVDRPRRVEVAIDVRHCGLGYVRRDGDEWAIGGAALLRDAERELAPVASGMLSLALRDTAPWLIRNMATVSGNIANASPAADSVPALIVLGATLALEGNDPERVPLEDVFVGPHRTTLGDRLIREIRVPVDDGRRAAFVKLARSASDIAQVNVAVSFALQDSVLRDVRVALGAVAPTPLRARACEQALEGQAADEQTLDAAVEAVREDVRPISDWRASEEYRRRMSGVLLRRAVERACQSTGNGESA